MRYLLDTNIVSDLIRNPRGPVVRRIRQVGADQVCTSIIVAAELRYGAAKRSSDRLTAQVERVLAALAVLPLEDPADAVYAEIRVGLESAGAPISEHDMLIAAHSMSLGCTVVTANEREFARVAGLRVENWLRDS